MYMEQNFMKGRVQMNAWFRFSSSVFKILLLACLFLSGAFIGETITLPFANWKIIAAAVHIFTILVTIVWFIGNLSDYVPEEKKPEETQETHKEE